MRWNNCLIMTAFAALLGSSPSVAANFGTVVPIGGHASDIALDESRGVLYIANFTANRIEVMSTADYSIHTSMNVAPQPGAITISPDNKFLLVTHYADWTITPPDLAKNQVTLINLNDGTHQQFSIGEPPLGAYFMADGLALIVTTTAFYTFDPISGAIQVIITLENAGKAMPAPQATFPPQIIEAQLAASADLTNIWGIGSAGVGGYVIFRYDARRRQLSVLAGTSSPPLLPRVSVAADGTWAMIGYAVFTSNFTTGNSPYGVIRAQYPDVVASANVTGSAIDSAAGIIYAQIPDATQPSGPPFAPVTVPPLQQATAKFPNIAIMDADNLTVRDRVKIPENLVGRALLSSNGKTMFAVSDSGVTVLPVGSLNQYPRIAVAQEDLTIKSGTCDHSVQTQLLTITDPGGGNTDFQIAVNQAGVTVAPSSGSTPATVQVRVDPAAFQNQTGTTAVTLQITSSAAVNFPQPVRLLVNNPEPNQRGTIINVPGRLTDMLMDSARNRAYILRQDKNLLLVFDASTYQQIAAFRTATTPARMAMTTDRKNLIVGHDNSQLAYVFDLDSMQQIDSIQLPFGHYFRSIADSNVALLAVARRAPATSATGGSSAWVGFLSDTGVAVIDRVDFRVRTATTLPSLGIWMNALGAPSAESALTTAPNGAFILLAEPDGDVKIYSASADTFVASRKDLPSLQGAFAASSYNTYVVGNNTLNQSLVPTGALGASGGNSSGFVFLDQGGLFTTAAAAVNPGVIQKVTSLQNGMYKPVPMSEAPLLPGPGVSFTRSVAAMNTGSSIVALTVSGFTVLPWNYDAAVAPPKITSVVNAADGTLPVAPGGLISVYGQQMAPVNIATSQIPLPTALGESCLTVNGVAVPVLFVSSQQINGQLPFNVDGNAQMTLRTPGGISDNFNFSILPAAPAVFRTGTAGPETGLATITRADNGEYVTPTNPVHPGDSIVIWATGLGRTSPAIDSGMPAPSDPLPSAVIQPTVMLGGVALDVQYAGLVPGAVGLYQINAAVPRSAPLGLSIPLVIAQGGSSTSLDVRVVK